MLDASQVAATRPRSARITGATDINSLLNDIGPGLWKSINPSYFSASDKLLVCTSHSTHRYNTQEGWDAPVRAGCLMTNLAPSAATLHERCPLASRRFCRAKGPTAYACRSTGHTTSKWPIASSLRTSAWSLARSHFWAEA
jgi:hypothetical protein